MAYGTKEWSEINSGEDDLRVGDKIDLLVGDEWIKNYATIIYFKEDGTPVAEMNYPGHDGCRWAHAYNLNKIRRTQF